MKDENVDDDEVTTEVVHKSDIRTKPSGERSERECQSSSHCGSRGGLPCVVSASGSVNYSYTDSEESNIWEDIRLREDTRLQTYRCRSYCRSYCRSEEDEESETSFHRCEIEVSPLKYPPSVSVRVQASRGMYGLYFGAIIGCS